MISNDTNVPGIMNYVFSPPNIVVDTAAQVASRMKEKQLMAELDTIRPMYPDKDQQILRLKQKLQAKQVEMTSHSDLSEQQEKMLAQKGI